jgi:hypothetical protein
MTEDRLALFELIDQSADNDLVRDMLAFAAGRMMEMEVEARSAGPSGLKRQTWCSTLAQSTPTKTVGSLSIISSIAEISSRRAASSFPVQALRAAGSGATSHWTCNSANLPRRASPPGVQRHRGRKAALDGLARCGQTTRYRA